MEEINNSESNRRCMSCEYCDTRENLCLIENKKCYQNGISLYPDCDKYEQGKWFVED